MNNDLFTHPGRFRSWIVICGSIVALSLLFNGTAQSPVVSGWRGDTTTLNALGAGAAPQPALTAVFGAQSMPESTGLAAASQPQAVPWGNPADSKRLVLTQGYDVGTHAPAPTWGGLDLALDGDGDGQPDPQGSMGAPLYATMSGTVELYPNSVPAGNHAWIKNDRYKVGYAHMKEFAVQDGQTVKRGDLIGYMGASGQASGPHLHYHIWHDGVNVNPLEYGVLP